MTLSPADKRQVLAMAAQGIVDQLRAEMGGSLKGLCVLPLATAAPMVGLTARTLREHVPTVATTDGKHGVTVADLESYLKSQTRNPQEP